MIASGSQDNTVRIWDTIAQQDKIVLDTFKEAIYNLSWNWDGSLLAVSSKDRKLRILDPRQKTVAQVRNPMRSQFIHGDESCLDRIERSVLGDRRTRWCEAESCAVVGTNDSHCNHRHALSHSSISLSFTVFYQTNPIFKKSRFLIFLISF